jgi:hypothetical protein
VLVGGKDEKRDAEQPEHNEVQGAVERDQSQYEAVAQRLAAQRDLDLVAVGRMLAGRRGRGGKGRPGVAAQAAVPSSPVELAGNHGILGPEPRGVGADEMVAGEAT